MADICPTHFVVPGVCIKSRFVNEDTGEGYRYYNGNVNSINSYGRDVNGTYVSCNIEYEDGETVSDAYLYDKDFEKEDSEDCWYFESKDSMLIKWVNQISNDTKDLKQAVASLQPLPGSDFSSEESEESEALESSEYSSVYDIPTKKHRNVILDISKVVLNIATSGFLLAYTYKLAIDYKVM